MSDPRYAKLATLLTSFSTKLLEGDKVLIDAFDIPGEMAVELVSGMPGAVAFVDADQVPKGLKVLKINGLLPGAKDYPLH